MHFPAEISAASPLSRIRFVVAMFLPHYIFCPRFQLLTSVELRYCSCSFSTTAHCCIPANMRRIALASRAPLKRKGFCLLFALPHLQSFSEPFFSSFVILILHSGCSRSCRALLLERMRRNWTCTNILTGARRLESNQHFTFSQNCFN